MIKTKKRPTGTLGELYDRVATYSGDPAGEIERLANEALSNGVLNIRRYLVVQHRLPFHEFERETYESVGEKLGRTTKRARQIEDKACEVLMMYILREQGTKIREERNMHEYFALSLDYLPWNVTALDTLARNGLKNLRWELSKPVTIGDVVKFFEELSHKGKPLVLKKFGRRQAERVYEVFHNAGIELPQVEVW